MKTKVKKGNKVSKGNKVVNTVANVSKEVPMEVVKPAPEETAEVPEVAVKVELSEDIKKTFSKLQSGQPLNAAEIESLQSYTRDLNKAKTAGQKEAGNAAKKAEAEAKHKQALNAHKHEVINLTVNFVAGLQNGKVNEINTKSDVKAMFTDFVNTLPNEPKKAGTVTKRTRKEGTTGTKTGLREGSIAFMVSEFLHTGKLTKDELIAKILPLCKDKKEQSVKWTVNACLPSGRFELEGLQQDGNKYFLEN